MASKCQAVNLSDEKNCTSEATSANGLFCRLHAKQAYGLYKGYKLRNAELDSLDANLPSWLAVKVSKAALRNIDFADVDDEPTLNDLHDHLFKKYALLDRVIRARKLHQVHFYPLDLDYGHKAWIDKLTNERFVTLRALERLLKRTAEVLYASKKWFQFVRQQQEEEEEARENESKQIKREADLFRRYMKDTDTRTKRRQQEENARRQEAFLDKAYEERQAMSDILEDDDAWDPIEDQVEDDRDKFVDIMRRLLWLSAPGANARASSTATDNHTQAADKEVPSKPVPNSNGSATASNDASPVAVASEKALNRNQKKRAKKQAKAQSANANGDADGPVDDSIKIEVNETAEEIAARLLKGDTFDWREGVNGEVLSGTPEHPTELHGKVLGLPQDEVDTLVEEIGEVKQLLLCRLLLGQATLLPVALKAASLQEFFSDPEVNGAQLRDLCLRLEQPSLQEIRDACADFTRNDTENDDDGESDAGEDEQEMYDRSIAPKSRRTFGGRRRDLPDYWKAKHERTIGQKRRNHNEAGTRVDFGVIDDDGDFENKKVRVKICGKTIWNYPSEQSIARRGWLHFSIIAKGTKLGQAIQLCRNWAEFYDLNILAIYGYFPNATWGQWAGDRSRSQFLQLGFIPRFMFLDAHKLASHARKLATLPGARSNVPIPQLKNVICAHIKRNDPVSRRFVQYLNLYTSELCIMVRDGKTGRIIIQPPKEEFWIARTKTSAGRWKVTGEINEEMFERFSDTHKYSDFRFSFLEHYDLIIWDLEPNGHHARLESRIHNCLIKAYRFNQGLDCYQPAAPVLKTIMRDRDTMRCRDVRAGEKSILDDLQHPGSRSVDMLIDMSADGKSSNRRDMNAEEMHERYYNEIDAAEDEVLFPEELQGVQITAIGDHADRIYRELESQGPSMNRFIKGLDTDDESDDPDLDEQFNRESPESKQNGKSGQVKPSKSLALRKKNAQFNGNQTTAALPRSTPLKTRQEGEDWYAAVRQAAEAREHKWKNDDDACPNDFAPDCECSVCAKAEGWDDASDFESDGSWGTIGEDDGVAIDDGITDADLELVETNPRELKRLKAFVFSDRDGPEDVEKQFYLFAEREKAKIFKPQFHAADYEPGAMERYAELQQLQERSRRVNMKSNFVRGKWAQTLLWLNCHHSEHRLVFRDVEATYAFVGLFFPASPETHGEDIAAFRKGLTGQTKLVDNSYKATQLPYYRDWRSDEYLPEDFWPPAKHRDAYRPPPDEQGKPMKPPVEWDAVTRPIIARLYKAGIIVPMHASLPCGRAIAREDRMTGLQTMYIDYRQSDDFGGHSITNRSHIVDFRKVELLELARNHNRLNVFGQSRFALLRIYSHPLFWPNTVGWDKRGNWSFEDMRGRAWAWKFYPKESAGGEWSIQHTIDLKLNRWRAQLGKNVKVRRDIVLVMGNDTKQLEEMMLGTVFALQTANWRLEVDFWRSFVDVDLEFLEALDSKWVE